ncbi:hypothetical protein [Alloyangia pacifica]|uniref:Uncharacterized protein n=1 Tax=Alloyangia pacifica TaxID=311180 RepID=A0A1I6QJD6_9RHOB|nr:hypothetical protein [Alloyangia pacifica]SDF91033.1 hypothetical protein SAMN04488245_101107 [Alloyangia pacifica]SFS52440.1 hypothetical protein SAMN04488050_102108 [Alloyangia pacifica]
MMMGHRQLAREKVGVERGPRAANGKELISVRGLLNWAFGIEFASMDFDEVGSAAVEYRPAVGAEYRIMQQLSLGKRSGEGVRPDTSFGRSLPHDDADLVASVLRNSVPWHMAIRVAELARAGRAPQWDLGPQRFQPREWSKRNHLGQYGKAEVCQEVSYVCRGRQRVRKEYWTPVMVVPSAREMASARREYLDWWGALLSVHAGLSGVQLRKFEVTDRMPPMTPWRK